jgi:two-component system cell cycle sensor histidine kinase/response regulator CckA
MTAARLAGAPDSGMLAASVSTNSVVHRDPRPACVLVVDDDARLREMAGRVLDVSGYAAVLAGTAFEALDLARRRPDINVALIDVQLPDMNGLDLATELRRVAPSVRVVFMSGFTSDHFSRPVEEPCVMKPFTIEMLTRGIEEAI